MSATDTEPRGLGADTQKRPEDKTGTGVGTGKESVVGAGRYISGVSCNT